MHAVGTKCAAMQCRGWVLEWMILSEGMNSKIHIVSESAIKKGGGGRGEILVLVLRVGSFFR